MLFTNIKTFLQDYFGVTLDLELLETRQYFYFSTEIQIKTFCEFYFLSKHSVKDDFYQNNYVYTGQNQQSAVFTTFVQ